jgi:hypothetical protein
MLLGTTRKFLFKCEECELIMAVGFDDPEDLQNIQEDKIHLECPCGAQCHVLRD